MGVEISYSDKVRALSALEEIKRVADAQRETSRTIERHTSKMDEAILQLSCWVAGLSIAVLLGVFAFVFWAILH